MKTEHLSLSLSHRNWLSPVVSVTSYRPGGREFDSDWDPFQGFFFWLFVITPYYEYGMMIMPSQELRKDPVFGIEVSTGERSDLRGRLPLEALGGGPRPGTVKCRFHPYPRR